ncbi:ABC transporter permease [Paenibacillus sinopodophylli]|uniref:ABC transporter permease n=1 Tax=Paenibacillus sinopodophylli TaxID=1837342 RepID=UPI001FEBC55F|nr:ABC transporter permease [Paenibacillus sinopodophylli]
MLSASLIIVFIVACAIFPEWIAPYSPLDMNVNHILQPPSAAYLLGTDQFGRDVFTLLVYGSRQSLLTGIGSVLIGGLAGALCGLLAGYHGRWLDTFFMRLIDVVMSIPGILLALAISVALGSGPLTIILAISVAVIPGYARVMRGQVIAVKSRQFIDAARAIGTPNREIMLRHILPNCLSPMLVMMTTGIGFSILISSALSFLGLGEISEIPDWGYLLSQGRSYMTIAWWIATFPGLAITCLVVSVNLIGDELRNRLDPRNS